MAQSTGWMAGVRFDEGAMDCLSSTTSRQALEPTQPHIQRLPEALSPGTERPRDEAHQSPPTSTEIKKTWIYTSTPTYAFMAYCVSTGTSLPFFFTIAPKNRPCVHTSNMFIFRAHNQSSSHYFSKSVKNAEWGKKLLLIDV
jgi:hypothetical protein